MGGKRLPPRVEKGPNKGQFRKRKGAKPKTKSKTKTKTKSKKSRHNPIGLVMVKAAELVKKGYSRRGALKKAWSLHKK